MFTAPGVIAVTTPALLTVAINTFCELQVTGRWSGSPAVDLGVATSVNCWPTITLVDGALTSTVATGVGVCGS